MKFINMDLIELVLFSYLIVFCQSADLDYWQMSFNGVRTTYINKAQIQPGPIPGNIVSLSVKSYYADEPEINKVINFGLLETYYMDGVGQEFLPQFVNLPRLKVLSVGFNNIRHVPKGRINTLNVPQISLTNNQISTIDAGAFSASVTQVDLNCNRLTSIEANWFTNPRNLEVLYLDGNYIDEIQDNMFNRFDSFRSLFLRHNRLTYIGDWAFSNRHSFSYLDFSYNQLKELKSYIFEDGLITIDELNISFNKLTYLSHDFLARVTVVNTAQIDGNPWQCSCYYHHIIKWVSWHNYGISGHKKDRQGEPRCVSITGTFDNQCVSFVNQELIDTFFRGSSPPPETREQYCLSKL